MTEPKGRHDIYDKLQNLKELAQPLGEKDDWWFPVYLAREVTARPHWEVWRLGDNSTVASIPDWEAHEPEQIAAYIAAAEPRIVATLIAFYDSTSDRLSETQAEVARLSAELGEARKDADQGWGIVKSLRGRLCKTLGLDQAARDMDIFDRIKALTGTAEEG